MSLSKPSVTDREAEAVAEANQEGVYFVVSDNCFYAFLSVCKLTHLLYAAEDSVPDSQASERLLRAALLKNRFADTILKAREKTMPHGLVSKVHTTPVILIAIFTR